MKIAITIIFGIILTFASFGLIGFATELTGLASNAKASDYFFTFIISVGVFGSPLVLGLYCALFRWICERKSDRIFIYIMNALFLFPLIAMCIHAYQYPNHTLFDPYLIIFIASYLLSALGIVIGKGPTSDDWSTTTEFGIFISLYHSVDDLHRKIYEVKITKSIMPQTIY